LCRSIAAIIVNGSNSFAAGRLGHARRKISGLRAKYQLEAGLNRRILRLGLGGYAVFIDILPKKVL
jgi:hypothetical protein